MRGISPIVSFVILVTILAIGTAALYYWVAGLGGAPILPESQTSVQVHIYNSTTLRITNIGVTNSTPLSVMSTTAGNCVFAEETVLMPGVTYSCTFPGASGEIKVWASGVRESSIYI